MQRYIYGNFHHAGFRTVSSDDTGFFDQYSKELAPLMYYDMTASHGDLPKNAHRCFWALTTSLNIPGGTDYLFLQESGLDPHRDATIVQGYRSDLEDGDLYGPRFMDILRTRFSSSMDALKEGETTRLSQIAADALPKTDFQPAELSPVLLERILLPLLQKRRVIIRLPSIGAAAMEDAKRYLMAIYQRLPYESRKNNGCLTGATAGMLDISEAFTIILVDGDTDLDGIEADAYQVVIDLQSKTSAKAPKVNSATSQLLTFLSTRSPKELDAFFGFCRENLEGDLDAGNISIKKYCSLLDIYTIDTHTLSSSDITKWAVSLNDNYWPQKTRQFICAKIASALPKDNLLAYLKAALPRYEDLEQAGVLGTNDLEKEQDAPRDQNAALTLRMMQELPDYNLDDVRFALEKHFVSAAVAQCPDVDVPTEKTVQALKALRLPGEKSGTTPWVNRLKKDVRASLESLTTRTERAYAEQYKRQKADGDSWIQAWTEQTPIGKLSELYDKLKRSNYLYSELVGDWNKRIAQGIVKVFCSCGEPAQLAAYSELQNRERDCRKCLYGNGGSFTPEQDQKLQERISAWKVVLELGSRKCTTAAELELWLRDINEAKMNPKLAMDLKRTAAKFLQTIPDGLPLDETLQRLRSADRYASLLASPKIQFEPWNAVAEAKQILRQIEALRDYRKGSPEPKLDNPDLCNWIPQSLPGNKDLMILLICRNPSHQEKLIPVLAAKGEGITEEDLEMLYYSGCSRQCLCQGAGDDTSVYWRLAVDAFSPTLPALPAPLKPVSAKKNPVENVLCTLVLVLFALAAAIPTAVMLLTGVGTTLSYIIIIIVLIVLTAVFICMSWLQKEQASRYFLRGLGIAAAPGIIAALAFLIVSML